MKTRTITIRGISDATLATLREAGKRNRRSLNAELLTILEGAALGMAEPFLPSGAVREPAAPPYPKARPAHRSAKRPADIDRTVLARVCRRFHIRSLAMFGSAGRGEESPLSDVDLLVEFVPGMVPGLGILTVADELAKVFGKPVDLVTPRGLSPRVRKQIIGDAVPLYHA